MEAAPLDRLTEMAIAAIGAWAGNAEAAAPPAAPEALTLLLHQYAATGRADLSDVLGAALPRAIELAATASTRDDQSSWLLMLVHAGRLSEDERIQRAITELRARIVGDWPSQGTVRSAMRSVEAVLATASPQSDDEAHDQFVAAIDELERVVSAVYAPGCGVAHALPPSPRETGTVADHVSAASALLSAYSVSGRLPYAMLADELMQCARRIWLNPESGTGNPELGTRNAELLSAVRVFIRLAALYAEADYRQAAVLAEIDYSEEAKRLLLSLAEDSGLGGAAAAECGLALVEMTEMTEVTEQLHRH